MRALTRGARGSVWLVPILLAALARPASAQSRPSEAPPPSCLDQSISDELGERLRPRGVQKRRFLKNKRLQVVGHGGILAGDLLSSSYAYGGALAFYFTEDLALELALDVSPMALDLDEPLAEFFGDDRFEKGTGYIGMASLLWSPMYGKLHAGDSVVPVGIFLAAGAGRIVHDSVQGVSFNAGMIVDIFATRWVSFRFDVRDVMAVQEAVAETRFTHNILATAGLSFWIPTGL